jgi:DNA-binding NtrC family response regulator
VGSTNAELEQLVASGAYRQDLLFRLSVFVLDLPPLRVRGDDVLLLSRAFLDRLCRQYSQPPRTLHPQSIAYLRQHSWPGNVRELENLIQRQFLLTDDVALRLPGTVQRYPLPSHADIHRPPSLIATSFREAKARAIAEFERAYIGELLKQANGNVSLAARLAGKERSRFGKLVRKYGMSRTAFSNARPESTSK